MYRAFALAPAINKVSSRTKITDSDYTYGISIRSRYFVEVGLEISLSLAKN